MPSIRARLSAQPSVCSVIRKTRKRRSGATNVKGDVKRQEHLRVALEWVSTALGMTVDAI